MLDRGGSPGSFKYSTAGAHLLSAVLTRAMGKSAREYANERLFDPIGMRIIPARQMKSFGFDDLFGKNVRGWVSDPAGNSTGGWGLTLTPRDMARFGFLYLNHGIWDGRQIVPAGWIGESTAQNAHHYGYLWWLCRENGLSAYAAMGDGGNMICCIPEKDTVVAIASEWAQNPRDRWELTVKHILPAMED
jgi:CubicO group peptidase (beta-lactamase class C family)